MWWKLGILAVATAALVFLMIPVRTHAVAYDPSKPPPRSTLGDLLGSMHLTPAAGLVIAFILAIAALIAVRIIRGHG